MTAIQQGSTTRSDVLSLYRRVWRFARQWRSPSGSVEQTNREADYIRQEAQTLFRHNANLRDETTILMHIREAESRMELADHYGTPYPRLPNVAPRTLAAQKSTASSQSTASHMSRRTERNLRESLPAYLRSYADKNSRDS